MSQAILSSSWYRVANLKPRLRPHARFYRHSYRGRTWFVLHDPVTGTMHQISAGARLVLNGMDGSRTSQQLFEFACGRLGEDAPSQDELIHLFGQLHAADLLQCDVNPDVAEIFERHRQQVRSKWLRMLGNPMSLKLPLFDPDRLLDALMPFARPLWNRWGAMLWLVVVVPALLLAAVHWTELTENLSDRVLAVDNLVVLLVLFPLIKAWHELGHGIAVKAYDGEVHDTGIMLLVLMPIPYVDASAATAFHSKWQRALVGAAGMVFELLVAALALYVWVMIEPGFARALVFNVVFIAGVSTVLFNINPLLRYDGYYMLSDIAEIPNLAQRSLRYCNYLIERYAFGIKEPDRFARTPGERIWYVMYAPLSLVYRIVISVGIILFIAGHYLVVGVLLAIWAMVTMLCIPVWKAASHLISSPRLALKRKRVRAVTAGALVALAAFLLLVPMPFRTQSEGVIWLPEQALVRAGANGFFSRLLVNPGARVAAGEPLVVHIDPALDASVSLAEAKVAELKATYAQYFVSDRVQAEVVRQQLEQEESNLARARERAADLIVHSGASGVFVVPRPADMDGRFLHKGDVIGYVVGDVKPLVRLVVSQGDIDLVRLATERIEVRSSHQIGHVVEGRVIRQVPGGTEQLPSPALGQRGGGAQPVDPRDPKGLTALQKLFQFDIDVELADAKDLIGGRAFLRFEHHKEPLAMQWYRSLRRLFLARFNV